MNGSHLPAGQPMPGGVGGGAAARGQVDMGSGPGLGGGRRRPAPQYPTHPQYHPQQHINSMYHNNYMNPYAANYYSQVPHHYPSGAIANAPYMAYNHYPQRSPPIHQQYPPIVSSSMQPQPLQPYSRPPPPPPPPQQPSPALSTPPPPYAPVTLPPPVPVPETPSSTHSSQTVPPPLTPPTPQSQGVASTPAAIEVIPVRNSPFKPPLPWLSRPDESFPKRSRFKRRRRIPASAAESVELPTNPAKGVDASAETLERASGETTPPETPTPKSAAAAAAAATTDPGASSVELSVHSESSSTQDVPSENAQSTSPSTPQSVQANQSTTAASATPTKPTKPASRAAVPAVPIVPVIPKAGPKDGKVAPGAENKPSQQSQATQQAAADVSAEAADTPSDSSQAETKPEPAPAPAKVGPKLWTGLFARAASADSAQGGTATSDPTSTGAVPSVTTSEDAAPTSGGAGTGGFSKSNASSLAEALRAYCVDGGQKISFLEPRGLINPGNMCYMNSVLQVLIFCIPFYDFLDQVGKKAAHSFKSETPLIDAMIMFMREYKVIDSAVSAEQLRRRLKSEELEQYGEPFTPEFVYDAIRKLPRFAGMRAGHQQDAEEFLGFVLEALHDECAKVMRRVADSSATASVGNSSAATPSAVSPTSTQDASDWLEVGRRQRAAVTRSSGHPVTSSPITKIFGGQLRSELRVQGLQDSVTLEPFQPLQLDIGSHQVHNIVDALKGLTRPETLHGDFGSPRGKDAVATKQVLIESLPPVLILHLKRFDFDTEGTGTVKIWKKVGYPLELELPKEIFSRQKRNALTAEGAGFPKYRLIAAVYHHGKNASGGHYTVDLRRQDGLEWIRLDDTVIRRVRSEDVAEGGFEEPNPTSTGRTDKKDGAAGTLGNRYEGIGDDEAADDEGWNKVSAPVNGAKKWSSVVNGASSKTAPVKGKQAKDNIKDNKVAYLLFYQKV
ncbi:cysteine proteinase [Durotheca rogersii]|uniref:cysteine proteinase n=1 Tax=Durotheca rogersii TaxID=419775 RepID=UPI00221F2E56|nr:cysteine proteinase [Durotheca rogersii]KAI5857319.1 cysteine proteinase [Durotheca rogersii]